MVISKDLASGLLFAALGLGGLLTSTSYRMGTLAQMGPGMFPAILSVGIAVLGAYVAAKALMRPHASEALERFHLRPLLAVLTGIVAFGFSIRSLGLVPAILLLIAISRLSISEGSWLETAVMSVVLTALCVGIFVYGLGLNIRLWPI
jgi:hypothetical protein